MTNNIVQIILCLMAWAVVLVRFRAMRWKDARKNNSIALKVWLMMFFVAVGITSMLDISANLDAYTLNNFSRLVTYCSFPIAINLGVTAAFDAVGKNTDRPLIRKLWLFLTMAIVTELIIYTLFLSKLPEFNYYESPNSLPETLAKLITHFLQTTQGLVVSGIFLGYLPSETSTVMRARVRMILVGNFAIGLFWIVMTAISLGYFWHFLASPRLVSFASSFVVIAIVLHLFALMNNRYHLKLALISKSFKSWRTFQELQSLVAQLILLCPVIGLPPENPPFWRFFFNPDYYLYRAVIVILDSKAMLADFLAKLAIPGTPPLWEDDLHKEAVRISAALEAVNPSNDFNDIVETYRRVSHDLFTAQKESLTQIG